MQRKRLIRSQMPIASEYQECKAFWEYAQNVPLLRDNLIKNVNEGKREKWYLLALLNVGMRPGLPDYHLPVPLGGYHGLWLEIKRRGFEGHKKDGMQDLWIARLLKLGHYATYAYGCDDAIRICSDYLQNKNMA